MYNARSEAPGAINWFGSFSWIDRVEIRKNELNSFIVNPDSRAIDNSLDFWIPFRAPVKKSFSDISNTLIAKRINSAKEANYFSLFNGVTEKQMIQENKSLVFKPRLIPVKLTRGFCSIQINQQLF